MTDDLFKGLAPVMDDPQQYRQQKGQHDAPERPWT
jgi:hypothetical protein